MQKSRREWNTHLQTSAQVSCPISEASYAGLLKTSKPFPKTENPNHANNPRNYIVLTQQKVTDNHF